MGQEADDGVMMLHRSACSTRKGSKPDGGNPPPRGSVHESPVRRAGCGPYFVFGLRFKLMVVQEQRKASGRPFGLT